jgi:aldehyde:ferredoxin oxidoreductase
MQPILKVNLTTGESSEYFIPKDWERDFLGGASLAARLLYPVLTREMDPFLPESPLLFLNGPLTGTSGPTVGRFVVCGKSPATELWAESNCGGFWGPELRFCGYDGIWITGRAKTPVFLWVNEGRLEIWDAADVWGKDTYESQSIIKNKIGMQGARVLTIGPAGENGVLFAGLFCDHGRTAGRTGMGAVAGSKNLKAIAVKGSKKIPLDHPDEYAHLRSSANHALRKDNLSHVFHDLGTAGVADYADYLGSMPKKYFSSGTFEGTGKVSGSTMAETILAGTSACHACVIACGRVVRLVDGVKRKGPEYETIVSFGPNLLNNDLASITRLGELCDRYGMDTISAGGTLGLAFHLYEKGVITKEDTCGLVLNWGDTRVVEQLLHLTARCEGIGKYLAQGSRRFGQHFKAEEEAVQVNGLEVAYHDPRAFSGMALVYSTSPRGACHNQSDYFVVDMGQADSSLGLGFYHRQAGVEKVANVIRHQNWHTVFNSLVMCIFANVPIETVVSLINSSCGLKWRPEDLFLAGERAWNLKRIINNNLGLNRTNDILPKALLEPYTDGGAVGYVPPLNEMLDCYYNVRDWDPNTGRPTLKKQTELGLEWTANNI